MMRTDDTLGLNRWFGMRLNLCLASWMGACGATLLVGTGCAGLPQAWTTGGWVTDYDAAEEQVRLSSRKMFIFYQDNRPGVDGPTEEALRTAAVKQSLGGFVLCRLLKSYEPDRRYAAQFGVDRAPAIVVVHQDGTYHARTGPMSAADIEAFLSSAKPPGAMPAVNPYIPRRPRYTWLRSIEAAKEAAIRTGRPILVVYHRSFSGDWQGLDKLLQRREVYRRFSPMVHCRVGIANPWAVATITRFGALKLPAMVVVRDDGTYCILELPTSYEAVVRFADTATRGQRKPVADTVTENTRSTSGTGTP